MLGASAVVRLAIGDSLNASVDCKGGETAGRRRRDYGTKGDVPCDQRADTFVGRLGAHRLDGQLFPADSPSGRDDRLGHLRILVVMSRSKAVGAATAF